MGLKGKLSWVTSSHLGQRSSTNWGVSFYTCGFLIFMKLFDIVLLTNTISYTIK